MQQLLAAQSQSLLSEIKSQVKDEVSTQLEPHATKLNQLQDDQSLLRNQLRDLASQLGNNKPPSEPCTAPHTPLASASNTAPPLINPNHVTPTLSLDDKKSIETAKCTLSFSPVTNDTLDRMKNNPTEEATTEELLKRALHDFLHSNMSIPGSTISKMIIKNIWHKEELDFEQISVEFSSLSPVNTIFKYVKNLSPNQKVSISIPPVLESRFDDLMYQAYCLRQGAVRHKTVIRYLGDNLALYAKKDSSRNWQLVTDLTLPPLDTIAAPTKRSRGSNSDHDSHDDDAKKSKINPSENESESDEVTEAETSKVAPSPATNATSGIPKPNLNTVPNYFKPKTPLQTKQGGFWPPNDPRSPNPAKPKPQPKNS